MFDSCSEMYEVEKIINCKTFRNKKYYLIKWLCYPIGQSTWEPKSSLKHLNYLLDEFEASYPFSIDQEMYNIFCEEVKKQKTAKNKNKAIKYPVNTPKFLGRKKKIEFFSDSDLNDDYYDKLKAHLYININKKQNIATNSSNDNLVIDLSSTNTSSEVISRNSSSEGENMLNIKDKNEPKEIPKLKMPIMA